MSKMMSPMELLTLFHKSEFSDVNLSVYEQKLLSVLISFVNEDLSTGYRAWPSTDTITKKSNIKETALTKARKKLLEDEWLLLMVPAKGPGRSMVYYINAGKIIDVAMKSNVTVSKNPVAKTILPVVTEQKHRNTSGLKNHKPVVHEDSLFIDGAESLASIDDILGMA